MKDPAWPLLLITKVLVKKSLALTWVFDYMLVSCLFRVTFCLCVLDSMQAYSCETKHGCCGSRHAHSTSDDYDMTECHCQPTSDCRVKNGTKGGT